jgi:hypothetical protein
VVRARHRGSYLDSGWMSKQRDRQRAAKHWEQNRGRRVNRPITGVDGDSRLCRWQKFQGVWCIIGPVGVMQPGVEVRVRSKKGITVQTILRVFEDEAGAMVGFPGR